MQCGQRLFPLPIEGIGEGDAGEVVAGDGGEAPPASTGLGLPLGDRAGGLGAGAGIAVMLMDVVAGDGDDVDGGGGLSLREGQQ